MDIINEQKEEMRWNGYGALSRLRRTRTDQQDGQIGSEGEGK